MPLPYGRSESAGRAASARAQAYCRWSRRPAGRRAATAAWRVAKRTDFGACGTASRGEVDSEPFFTRLGGPAECASA